MKLYRLMKVDADGRPRIGTSFGTLGVRPPGRGTGLVADIEVDANGNVHPGFDGMSTFDRPLAPDRRHALWFIEIADENDLGPDLCVVSSPHTAGRFHMTPCRVMSLSDYQAPLAATRELWVRVESEGNES